jgi:alanine racemase
LAADWNRHQAFTFTALQTTDSSTSRCYRTWAEIDLAALSHNAAVLRGRMAAGSTMMGVVKANAYGHGVGNVVRELAGKVEMFGVANVTEALAVRDADSSTPVFILGPALPEERREIVANRFIPAVSGLAEAQAYAAIATDSPVAIHLVLDTGMGRIGIWEEEAVEIAREIFALPGLEVQGISSHLPVADEDEEFTGEQLVRFHALCDRLRALSPGTPQLHVANSAGIIGFGARDGDMVRAGLALYGSSPIEAFQQNLKPVLTWKTRVTLVRDVGPGRGISYGRTYITAHPMRVATLAVGYADGFQRHLSNQGAEVLIDGQRCPVLGRVTMDQIVVDVSHVPDVVAGTEVVLLGRQGDEEILAAEMARKAGTIPWEVFTGIGPRVVRVPRCQ